jgi:hypothetical protein
VRKRNENVSSFFWIEMKPFVLISAIRITTGLYPTPASSGALGEVLEAEERRQEEVERGSMQAGVTLMGSW